MPLFENIVCYLLFPLLMFIIVLYTLIICIYLENVQMQNAILSKLNNTVKPYEYPFTEFDANYTDYY